MTASEQNENVPFDEMMRTGSPADAASDDALAKAQAEAAEMRDAWLRARAETENVRRQAQVDISKAHKYAIGKTAVGKTAVGENDDENDVEAHKYAIGKTAVGADDDADDKPGIS